MRLDSSIQSVHIQPSITIHSILSWQLCDPSRLFLVDRIAAEMKRDNYNSAGQSGWIALPVLQITINWMSQKVFVVFIHRTVIYLLDDRMQLSSKELPGGLKW